MLSLFTFRPPLTLRSRVSQLLRASSSLTQGQTELLTGSCSPHCTKRRHPKTGESLSRAISTAPSLQTSTSLTLGMAEARYCVEYARSGRSSCKKCKQQIEKGVGRIGKITANAFSDDGGEMKMWYHMRCMFETLKVRWGWACGRGLWEGVGDEAGGRGWVGGLWEGLPIMEGINQNTSKSNSKSGHLISQGYKCGCLGRGFPPI